VLLLIHAADIYQVDKSATGEITKKKLFGVMVRSLNPMLCDPASVVA
jgi:hypothetical protein